MTNFKSPFKVGDIIIGNSDNKYSETRVGILCKVILLVDNPRKGNPGHCDENYFRDILVERCDSDLIYGSPTTFQVSSYFFNKVESQDEDNQI